VDFDLVVTPEETAACTLGECLGYSATPENPETLAVDVNAYSSAFIFVEAASPYAGGDYILTIDCGTTVEVCDNGSDDDGDFVGDCIDPDCASDPSCLPVENCFNGIDEDADGSIDCGDPDCAAVCVP